METYVSGLANVKKCNQKGRAVMLLDWASFANDLQLLTTIRPLPLAKHVENYMKAYYLSDNEVLDWLRNHPEYTKMQLIGLVNQGPWDKKKQSECIIWLNGNR